MKINILGIESSCDDTGAAIVSDGILLSNVIAGQEVHKAYGGVVPELASRAHQQNIVPVVDRAIKQAGIGIDQISGIAFTQGPGLLGSLLVGSSFAKGFSLANNIPLIAVNHLQGHILSPFIQDSKQNELVKTPTFPFLCLLVSGGHSQLVVVKDYFDMQVIGQTIDDAAGEAFDKCAKIMGIPYPGGPLIDKYAKKGNSKAFTFSKPRIKGLDYSFSGLKTSFLYSVRDAHKLNKQFVTENIADLSASIQQTIVEILMDKLIKAVQQTGITQIALTGGVSANSALRQALKTESEKQNWDIFIPPALYSTDNAAMIAMVGYYKYLKAEFSPLNIEPKPRFPI